MLTSKARVVRGITMVAIAAACLVSSCLRSGRRIQRRLRRVPRFEWLFQLRGLWLPGQFLWLRLRPRLGLGPRLVGLGLGRARRVCLSISLPLCLRLPIRWRLSHRAGHDLQNACATSCHSIGAVLLHRRLCLPHGTPGPNRHRLLLHL